LRSDGKVEAIAQSTQTASVGTATQVTPNITEFPSLVYDASSGKVVFTYKNGSNSSYPYAAVGTISGTSISFGTPVVIFSNGVEYLNTAYDSANEKIIVVYRNAANNYGNAQVGTVSGTSISFGSDYTFSGAALGQGIGIAYDSSNSKFVVNYGAASNSDRGTAIVGTVSGTSITYGSATTYDTEFCDWFGLTYDSANQKVVAINRGGGDIRAYVGTVSGTSISFGSATAVNSGQTGEFNAIGYDVQSGKVVAAYEDRGNSYYGTARVGTVSGTSISFGTPVVFRTANTGNAYFLVGYDASVKRTNIFFRIYSPSDQGLVATGTVSGTSITFDANFTVASDNRYTGAAYDSVNKKWGYYVRPVANDLDGVVFTTAGTVTNLTDTNFIGISDAAISNAASGSVTIKGGISTNVTGLTPNQTYYVQADGVIAASGSVPFSISGATFTQNFSVSAQDSSPRGIAFNTDGTKMFITGSAGVDINEYALTTGFDISTASYSQNFSVISQTTSPRGVAFNTDGTKMFVVGQVGSTIYEYNLATGFNISTASYSQNFSLSSQETGAQDVAFNTDGTKMFIVGTSGQDVNEYTLSTGFDVSSASYSQNFSVSSQDTIPTGITFNTDGTSMFITGQTNDKVFEYTLTSGFDVSTASYSSTSFSVLSEESNPLGLVFNSNGTKMFITGTTGDDVNEYSTTAASTTVPAGKALSATSINLDYTT
jgi:glutamine cyclotransferase